MATKAQRITQAVNWAKFRLRGARLSMYPLTSAGLKVSVLSFKLANQIESDLRKLELSLEKDRQQTIEELKNEHDA